GKYPTTPAGLGRYQARGRGGRFMSSGVIDRPAPGGSGATFDGALDAFGAVLLHPPPLQRQAQADGEAVSLDEEELILEAAAYPDLGGVGGLALVAQRDAALDRAQQAGEVEGVVNEGAALVAVVDADALVLLLTAAEEQQEGAGEPRAVLEQQQLGVADLGALGEELGGRLLELKLSLEVGGAQQREEARDEIGVVADVADRELFGGLLERATDDAAAVGGQAGDVVALRGEVGVDAGGRERVTLDEVVAAEAADVGEVLVDVLDEGEVQALLGGELVDGGDHAVDDGVAVVTGEQRDVAAIGDQGAGDGDPVGVAAAEVLDQPRIGALDRAGHGGHELDVGAVVDGEEAEQDA